LVTVVLVAGLLIGLDYLFGFRGPALRLLLTASLAGSAVWAVGHLLTGLPKITPLGVALQLKPFYPELGDRLASAVEFSEVEREAAREADPTALPVGSAALRQVVILHAAQDVEEVDWSRLLPLKRLGRAILMTVVVTVGVGAFAMLAPQTLQIGLSRLLHPLGQAQWPGRHDLHAVRVVAPPRLDSLDVVPDMPPHVAWVEPSGDLTVVSDARVKLVVAATDDQGLGEVSLVFRLAESAAVQPGETLVLFRQAESHPGNSPLAASPREGATRMELSHTLSLAGWDLRPGQTLLVEARARDTLVVDGRGAPRTGQTDRPLRLRIVSQAVLLRLVRQGQSTLVERLTMALVSQQVVRDRLSDWSALTVGVTGGPEQADLLTWQRQIAPWLDHVSRRRSQWGAVQQIDQLLHLYGNNGLADSETGPFLDRLRTDLIELARRVLPDVETRLDNLLLPKSSLRSESPWPSVSAHSQPADRATDGASFALARDEILSRQETVIGTLQRVLEELAHWNTLQQFTRQFQQLGYDQRQLFERCRDEWAPQFWAEPLGTDSGEGSLRTPEQEVPWGEVVAAQRRLARHLGRLIGQMESAAARRASSQPEVAKRLAGVARAARRQSVQATLQGAADQLSQRRLGRAMTLQQQALEQLRRLSQKLAGKQLAGATKDGQRQARQAADPDSESGDRQPDGSQGNSLPGRTPAPSAAQVQTVPISARAMSEAVGSLVHDLWGALPARQRQRIVQPVGEEFLPQYADDIGAYFRALAEPAAGEVPLQPRRSEP
jgi:hypothetical protein